MKTPVYTRYEYVDATAFTLAASQLAANVSLIGDVAVIGGLVNNSSMTTGSAGLVMTVNLPAPFGIINNSGVLAQAHGTVTNQDTSTYTVDFTSFVPGSSSQVVYLIATLSTISQDPYQIVGPPAGHPSYVANFISFTAYATTVDTLGVTATLTPPNNTTHFELGRFTLTAGAVTLPALSTINQILAAPLPVMNFVSVTSNRVLTVANAGVAQRADAAALTFTLPDSGVANGYEFPIVARTSSTTVQIATGGDLIYGVGNDPSTGVTSVVIPKGSSLTLASDGAAYQAVASNGTVGAATFVTISVAGSANVTLTAAQAACDFIQLTGVITGSFLLLIPAATTGVKSIRNATTGAFTITAQYVAGGTSIVLASGTTQISGNGTNIYYAGSNFLTQAISDSTTNAATTAFVHNYVGSLSSVTSFNTRTGAVTLTSADVTTALGFSPVQSFNTRTGIVTLTSGDVTTALTYTPVNNGSGTILGTTNQLVVDAAAGTIRRFQINTAGNSRWRWGGDITAESGGNAGTNFFLQAFDDSGSLLGPAFNINRATRVADFPIGVTVPNQTQGDNSANAANTHYVDVGLGVTLTSAESYTNTYALPLTGGTVSGNLTVGDGSAGRSLTINGATSTLRSLFWQTNGSNRWIARASNTAESGSNVGSDWQLIRIADDGSTNLGTAILVTRSTGVVNIANLTTATQAQGDNSTNAATTRYADLAAAGAVTTITSDFTGANQSLVTNGYQNILGGFQVCWGTVTLASTGNNTSSAAVSFSSNFPTACFGVSVTAQQSANAGAGGWPAGAATTITRTGFTAVVDTLGYTTITRSIPCSWFAWGH